MGLNSAICHPTQVNTPHLNSSQTGQYSTYILRRDGRLSWPRWLVTTYILKWFTCLQTHPSTNRAQCWLTMLIKTNVLSTTLHCHPKHYAAHNLVNKYWDSKKQAYHCPRVSILWGVHPGPPTFRHLRSSNKKKKTLNMKYRKLNSTSMQDECTLTVTGIISFKCRN